MQFVTISKLVDSKGMGKVLKKICMRMLIGLLKENLIDIK